MYIHLTYVYLLRQTPCMHKNLEDISQCIYIYMFVCSTDIYMDFLALSPNLTRWREQLRPWTQPGPEAVAEAIEAFLHQLGFSP